MISNLISLSAKIFRFYLLFHTKFFYPSIPPLSNWLFFYFWAWAPLPQPLLEKIPRVGNHRTANIPTYRSIFAQVDAYTEKIGIVYETINVDNWSRALTLASGQLTKEKKIQIEHEWGVVSFPLNVFCDFEKLHYLITRKRLDDARLDSIQTKLKCERSGLKSDWDRAEFDFFRAIKSFNLQALRRVLKFMNDLPGNAKLF